MIDLFETKLTVRRKRGMDRWRERERERKSRHPPFQTPLFRVSWTWFDSSSGRLWVYKTSRAFRHILHWMDFDLGTSKSYV